MRRTSNEFFSAVSDFFGKIMQLRRSAEESRQAFNEAAAAMDERSRLILRRIAEQNETDYKRLLVKNGGRKNEYSESACCYLSCDYHDS